MLWKVLWLGIFTSFAYYVFELMLILDFHKRVYNHKPGPCRRLEGIVHGSEDVAFVESRGLAFISSGCANLVDRPGVEGNIFLFDFNNPSEAPIKLPIHGMTNRTTFRPHGITHWVSEEGEVRLYVINHTPPEWSHLIEVFDYIEGVNTLQHVKTIRSKKFIRPNGIVAVAKDKFIISNDAEAQSTLANLFEFLTFQKLGTLVFYDGEHSYIMARKLMSPNGIAITADKKHLLVAHINEKSLGVYKLTEDFKHAIPVSRLSIGTAIDNLYIDTDGQIWTAAHPIVKDLLSHFLHLNDSSIKSPSQVLLLKPSADWQAVDITEVFVDDGSLLTASSGAVHHNGKVLIGSIFAHAVVCDIFEEL